MTRVSLRSWRSVWPFAVLVGLLVLFIALLTFSRKAPVIASLEPAMAAPGQTVTISGDYFGRTAREGTLSLSGEIPPPSLIQSWSDQRVVFVVPPDAASGLVSISNSQGSSTGVLFTNTQSIPTVLQSPSDPEAPLLWLLAPSAPSSGQIVTVTGRGLGSGDEAVSLRLEAGPGAPVFELSPKDCLEWSSRSISFRLPPGIADSSVLRVSTPRGTTDPLPVSATSSVVFGDARTAKVTFRVTTTLASADSLALVVPTPQGSLETGWSVSSADPVPLAGFRSPVFLWSNASPGPKVATYTLNLKSWERQWRGPPSVPATGGSPSVSEESKLLWKPAAGALKILTAKWGLETADPWLRITRIQTGMSGAFRLAVAASEQPRLTGTPATLLTNGALNSYEASSLALYLAASTGIPARLVGGLWLNDAGTLISRTWVEFWLSGAGWTSWDPIDGSPGALDNRHFAFGNAVALPPRQLPRSRLLPSTAPGSLASVHAEISGDGPDPVVVWEILPTEK